MAKHEPVKAQKKRIGPAMYITECPICGRELSSASSPDLLPDEDYCSGTEEKIYEPKSKICTVRLSNGAIKRGEYTGFSQQTKLHYISLYNGAVVRMETLDNVIFDTPLTDEERKVLDITTEEGL